MTHQWWGPTGARTHSTLLFWLQRQRITPLRHNTFIIKVHDFITIKKWRDIHTLIALIIFPAAFSTVLDNFKSSQLSLLFSMHSVELNVSTIFCILWVTPRNILFYNENRIRFLAAINTRHTITQIRMAMPETIDPMTEIINQKLSAQWVAREEIGLQGMFESSTVCSKTSANHS